MLQLIAALVFFAFLSIFLFLKRKQLTVQKILFPFLYLVLYRSDYGLNLMDSAARRLKLLLRVFGFFAVVFGFAFMLLISFVILKTLFNLLVSPGAAAGIAIVVPIPIDAPGFLPVPTFYWIISIFILAVVHEFAHGALARVHNIHVKSTGFAFLGILIPVIPAAFVEPDEKILKRKTLWQKLSVFASGAFANIVLAFLILGLLMLLVPLVSSNVVDTSGVRILGFTNDSASKEAGIPFNSVIVKADNVDIKKTDDLTDYISRKKPGDKVVIEISNSSSYAVKLGRNPENNRASLGIYMLSFDSKANDSILEKHDKFLIRTVFISQYSELNDGFVKKYGGFTARTILWFVMLLVWLYVLNFGIGIFNLLPLGPIDGGRMLHAVLAANMEESRANKIWLWVSIFFFTVVIFSLLLSFFR